MMRTYAITGAASGIGRATKELLEREGARVITVDRELADVTADLGTVDGRSFAIGAVGEQVDGELDGVIACAGIWGSGPACVSVNYFGAVEVVEGLRPRLQQAQVPRAVLVSSAAIDHQSDQRVVDACLAGDEDAAVRIVHDVPHLGYSSSKLAIARWVRRAAVQREWAGSGIALNAVAPGVIDTPLSARALGSPEGRAQLDKMIPMPLGGPGRAEQVAPLLVWLASPINALVTGQVIYIDGGADAVLRGDNIWTGP